jgi:hypothetical protein
VSVSADGTTWRFLAWAKSGDPIDRASKDGEVFDELVVDDWLHIEKMDRERWWMRVGDVVVWVQSGVVVSVERDP